VCVARFAANGLVTCRASDLEIIARLSRGWRYVGRMTTVYEWRGAFTNQEINELHAEAFRTEVFGESEWNWEELVRRHSLGWVVAREGTELVGFVNVVWDGLVHAWLQDTMVAASVRGEGIGTQLVALARDGAKAAGCQYLHVDFEDHLRPFYFGACGFAPTNAGLLTLH
jgi:GNAT superfamily N-acetyltransferase